MIQNPYSVLTEYEAHHFVRHLFLCKDTSKRELAYEFLTDLYFLELKCCHPVHFYSLVSDYEVALETIRHLNQDVNDNTSTSIRDYVDQVMIYGKEWKFTAVCPETNSHHLQPELLPKPPKMSFPNPPCSVKPYAQHTSGRESELPNCEIKRLRRLESFSRFVSFEAHNLVAFGYIHGFCLQQAHNWTVDSPVSNSARSIITNKIDYPAFLRRCAVSAQNESYYVPTRVLMANNSPVHDIAMSADGNLLLCACHDGIARFWDITNGRCLRSLSIGDSPLKLVGMNALGSKGIAVDTDNMMCIWDLNTGECTSKKSLVAPADALSVTADGELAVTGGGKMDSDHGGNPLFLWETQTGNCVGRLSANGRRFAVSVSADGRRIASGGWTCVMFIWDIVKRTSGPTLMGHNAKDIVPNPTHVFAVALDARGECLLSGSNDRTVRVWDAKTEICRGLLEGTMIYSSHICRHVLKGHAACISSVALSADAKRGISLAEDGELRSWDMITGDCLATFTLPGTIRRSAENVMRKESGWTEEQRRWLTTGIQDNKETPLRSLAINSDASVAATAGGGGSVYVWNLRNIGNQSDTHEHQGGVSAIAGNSIKRLAITGGYDGILRLWDTETGEFVRSFEGHHSQIKDVEFSCDGNLAVSGSIDGTVRLWEVGAGICRHVFEGHHDWVNCIRFTDNGRQVISGGADGLIRVWDCNTGCCLHTLRLGYGWVACIDITRYCQMLCIKNLWNPLRGAVFTFHYPSLRSQIHGETGIAASRRNALALPSIWLRLGGV